MPTSTTSLALALLLLPADVARAASWVMDDTCEEMAIYGLGVADASHAAVGATSASGALPAFYNASTGCTFTANSPSGAIMDLAALPNNEAVVYATFAGQYLSTDQGASWNRVGDAVNPIQSVTALKGDSFALAGEFTTKELGYFGGVILSTDKGSTWTSYPIDGAQYVRYGAYPSDSTWYVTEGSWPSTGATDNANANAAEPFFVHASPDLASGGADLSANIRIGKGAPKRKQINLGIAGVAGVAGVAGGLRGSSSSGQAGTDYGYVANIWKTSDGGKTFAKVFSSEPTDAFYFNAISCGSETTCVAVAEGKVQSNSKIITYQTFAYHTSDGGKTWSQVFDGGDAYMSLLAVKMVSETEGWMGPSGLLPGSNTVAVTDFYQTTDGGATWSLGQTLQDCVAAEIDSADGLVMAACMGHFSSATVAVYK